MSPHPSAILMPEILRGDECALREAAGARQSAAPVRGGDRRRQRRELGNFPQAFTHLSLIHAVMGVTPSKGRLRR